MPHGCPLASLQVPLPSHALLGAAQPESGSGCPWATNALQIPVPLAHDRHAVVQAFSQQVLSTQNPDEHSLAWLHGWPRFLRHAPSPSQE